MMKSKELVLGGKNYLNVTIIHDTKRKFPFIVKQEKDFIAFRTLQDVTTFRDYLTDLIQSLTPNTDENGK